jgi:two-component system sensor histidine kinase VanS
MTGDQDNRHMAISLYMKLEEGVYLIAETPKAYLQDISQRAVIFTAIISGVTFFIGGIIIFLLSGAVTAPIRRIQDTADEIANLNFTHRCDEKSGDELGHLAHSINNMADRLQENINQLTVANATLKEELMQTEKMERGRREFIANVSHDFKTPSL